MFAAVIVGYDKKLHPSFVRCGLCGETLPPGAPWLASCDENFARVVAQFELHAAHKHLRKPNIEPVKSQRSTAAHN
jgi:hypothetical protein